MRLGIGLGVTNVRGGRKPSIPGVLEGVIAGTGNPAAAIIISRLLAGTIGGSATLDGLLDASHHLVGTISGSMTLSGSIGQAPNAPTLTWTSDSSDNKPNFSVALPKDFGDYRDAAVGDVYEEQYQADDTSWVDYFTYTLLSGDLSGIDATVDADEVPSGTRNFRGHLVRAGSPGNWSSSVSVTISTGGGADSALKRRSFINLMMPFRSAMPPPDGSFGSTDRTVFLKLYARAATADGALTASQRGSMMNLGAPWRTRLPAPDGTIAANDRAALLKLYG